MEKLLVLLDLDETLIYSTVHKYELSYKEHDFAITDGEDTFRVFKRPHLDDFLDLLFSNKSLEVGVWTSANHLYASRMIPAIFGDRELKVAFNFNRLVKSYEPVQSMYGRNPAIYLKDLKKVKKATGYPFERILAVDDIPSFFRRQYSNLIQVKPFIGLDQKDDTTLLDLADYIFRLEKVSNVRKIEKRGWLSRYQRDNHLSL